MVPFQQQQLVQVLSDWRLEEPFPGGSSVCLVVVVVVVVLVVVMMLMVENDNDGGEILRADRGSQ